MANKNNNSSGGSMTILPLKNVSLCTRALERAIGRANHLPGIVEMHGPNGFGKSYSACYCMNEYNAVYVQAQSTWTRKAILLAIAKALGLTSGVSGKTMYEITEVVSERLALSNRPLIVDEMDHIINQGAVEVIRDIYEGSLAPILLIGEENMPNKLRQWERFHGRILDFVAAQPADAEDARILAEFYCPKIKLEADLLASLAEAAGGSIRRICVNLDLIQETALGAGKKVIDLGAWTAFKKGFWTGQTIERRFQ